MLTLWLFICFRLQPVACGILPAWPGMESVRSALEAQSLSYWISREVLHDRTFRATCILTLWGHEFSTLWQYFTVNRIYSPSFPQKEQVILWVQSPTLILGMDRKAERRMRLELLGAKGSGSRFLLSRCGFSDVFQASMLLPAGAVDL